PSGLLLRAARGLVRHGGAAARWATGAAAWRPAAVTLADDQGLSRPAHPPRSDLLPRPLLPRETQSARGLAFPARGALRRQRRLPRATRRPVQSARVHRRTPARLRARRGLAKARPGPDAAAAMDPCREVLLLGIRRAL